MQKLLIFDANNELVIKRGALLESVLDIGGRDIFVAFNEPKFKFSDANLEEPDLDAKLSGRFITYFLPAIYIAKQQKVRPRLFLISGLNMALKWNSYSERERKIMMVNNNLKLDFAEKFFERFFPDAFSIVETVVAQDPLKISEEKLLEAWDILEKEYPGEMREVKVALARFVEPKLFSDSDNLLEKAEAYFRNPNQELKNAFKYAISHLFVFADINFEGNYIHNPIGYLSIGGRQERYFNMVRWLGYKRFAKSAKEFFGREVILRDNLKLVVEDEQKLPPSYNPTFIRRVGAVQTEDVTFEDGRSLDFYDTYEKLRPEMQFMYDHFVPKDEYVTFWNSYRERYLDRKERYAEAYQLGGGNF